MSSSLIGMPGPLRKIVPLREESKTTSSAPDVAFASLTALRRLPAGPGDAPSLRFVTVKVAASAVAAAPRAAPIDTPAPAASRALFRLRSLLLNSDLPV